MCWSLLFHEEMNPTKSSTGQTMCWKDGNIGLLVNKYFPKLQNIEIDKKCLEQIRIEGLKNIGQEITN